MTAPDTDANAGKSLAALAFVIGAGFFAYAFALRVAPSVMVTELMATFAVGAAVLGHLSAFYFYTYAGLQIPVGLALDRYGPRRLMTVAALLVAVGCWRFATAETVEAAYLGRALIGVGCAFSWPGTLNLVHLWFPQRFALLAGVSQFIAMGGAMLGQAPLAAAVERHGWRDTTLALAGLGLVIAVLIGLAARDGKKTGKAVTAGTDRWSALLSRQTLLAAGFGLAMTAGVLTIGGLWGVPYLVAAYGLPRTEAAGLMSLAFLGHGCGCVLVGWWSDTARLRRLPMATGAAVCVSAQLVYLLVPDMPIAVLGTVIFLMGLGGASMVLPFALARESHDPRVAGLIIGAVNTAVVGAGAIFQPLVGLLLDAQWTGMLDADGARVYAPGDYVSALLVLPAAAAIGLLLVLFMRETHAQQAEPVPQA